MRLATWLLCLCLAGQASGQGGMPPPAPIPPMPVPVPGQPYVNLPATVSGQPGAFLTIAAQTNGREVAWYSPDSALQLFPVELLRSSKTAIVIATVPGTYRLVAFTALADLPARSNECLVTIGQPGPVPPGPVPPGPVPPPNPAPDLQRTLQAAYDRDDDADKAESIKTLAAIYKRAGTAVEAAGMATLRDADEWVRNAAFVAIGGIRVASTRDAIARYMKDAMGSSKPNDPLDKTKFKSACDAVAAALGGLR